MAILMNWGRLLGKYVLIWFTEAPTKFGAFIHSATILPKIDAKPPN